jgi:phospho-N-acetylmuramoyl-pentapeptide-transferase
MGEVLIAATASLLMCVFLSPRFISFLRAREFGQQIREEGPQEHHAKAGTPTMGGIIIFTAFSVPFLLLTDWDWRAIGVFGTALACALLGFADDYTKLVKRRSLGLQGRWKLIVTVLIAIGLWLAATVGADLPDTVNLRIVDAHIDLGFLYPVFIYLVLAGTTSAVNLTDGLDGLAARRSCCSPTSRSRSPRGRPTWRWSPAAWSGPASGSSGSTRSRRRSSWATRARSASAAGSRRSP